jgi:metal-responsive CopG/Arc/MetJ family transcriptional regulator
MRLAKRTYSLPPDLLDRFEHRLGPGERSAFVAKLIHEWLDESERAELRRQVVEGCQEMSGVYHEIAEEWEPLAEEVWRDNG